MPSAESRRHTPGIQPGLHMHEYTAYVPGILIYLRCIYVSKLVTAQLLSLG